MLRTIRRVLRKLADGGDQVFFTTHSPVLVDVGYFDEIIRVEAGTPTQGAKIYQLPMAAMIGDLEARWPNREGKVTDSSIRERYSHVYTASRNEGFFAKQVILVEGATEIYCLPIYAASLGCDFDNMGIVVVECGTKEQIDRLYRIFNELGIPCYVVFDYDLGGEGERSSDELLNCLGVNIKKPTTAVIEERFACFAKNWEADLMPEIPDYQQLAGDATKELGLRSDSSKPLKARYIAHRLTAGEKPIVPPTLEKIITRAIQVTHAGSCLRKKAVDKAAAHGVRGKLDAAGD